MKKYAQNIKCDLKNLLTSNILIRTSSATFQQMHNNEICLFTDRTREREIDREKYLIIIFMVSKIRCVTY